MIDTLNEFIASLSPAAKGAILFVILLQCILQIYCVVDLVRRHAVTGGNKWLWGVLVVAGGVLGSLLYLALGRAQVSLAADTDGVAGDDSATRRAIDNLYGDKK